MQWGAVNLVCAAPGKFLPFFGLLPIPNPTTPFQRLHTQTRHPYPNVASSVISAFSSFEIGQFAFASFASSMNLASSIPSTFPESVRSERVAGKRSPSVSRLTSTVVSSAHPRAPPLPARSLAPW